MVKEVFAEKEAFQKIFGGRGRKPCGKRSISDSGNQVFKGPEVRVCLVGLSTTKEASVAGSELGGRGVLEEGIEVMDHTA